MKKRLAFTLMVILICIKAFFLANIYANYNLKYYSVYYAKHTPHKKGVEPVLMMLIENLGIIYQPDSIRYQYDLDGFPSITINNRKGKHIGTYMLDYGLPTDKYVYNDWNHKISASFDKDFNMTDLSQLRTYKKLKVNHEKEKQFKQELYHQLKPLIDEQPTPWINLQWLFDQRYHDQFN